MNFRLELPSGIRWSPLLIATAIAGVAGAFVVVDHGFSLFVDLFRSSSTVESVDVTTPLLAQHEETHGLYERRFEGRSLFFAPPDCNGPGRASDVSATMSLKFLTWNCRNN
jgi:hypothetical protein